MLLVGQILVAWKATEEITSGMARAAIGWEDAGGLQIEEVQQMLKEPGCLGRVPEILV